MKIAVIPIDNRPICYDLIEDILSIDKNIELCLPQREFLGGLIQKANIDELFSFLEKLNKIDYLIISLDTIAYGGLVSSRRCKETYFEIESRIEKLTKIIKEKNCKTLAFSSIMRISNNNINEEEKEYWSQYGKRIFDWSYHLHKSELEKTCNCVHNKVPNDILKDYLETRKRNFNINKLYLDLAKNNVFDTLIFSKDDCAEFGLNIKEANELDEIIKKENIINAKIKTGADEIPLSLISRAITQKSNISINPIFVENKSIDLISKYEDITIKNCVLNQIELANCKIDVQNPDLNFIINNFQFQQGDLVLGDLINKTNKEIDFNYKTYFIADVNNANGADENLINQLFKQKISNFFGYCGYNTSANSIGCCILCALIKYNAIKNSSYDDNAFRKIQFIRLMDDWAYQSIVRKFVRESGLDFNLALEKKQQDLNEIAQKIANFLNYHPKEIKYSLPWNRSFEIRIELA